MKNQKEFIKELIGLFAEKTSCSAQYAGCPCNTCFHSMDKTIDYQHIIWGILLGLRGDYEAKMVLDGIREELKLK